MKRISHISLFLALVALVYINLGDLARIEMGLADAKMEATKTIGGKHLTTLNISPNDFANGDAAYVGASEIRYLGHLYDIATREKIGNVLHLTVAADEKEDGLLGELKEHVEQLMNTPAKSTNNKPSLKHADLLKDFIPANKLALSFESYSVILHTHLAVPTLSLVMPVAGNPPQAV